MSKYLEFVEKGNLIRIFSKRERILLGVIIYFDPWKQFVFEPSRYDSVFNDECLKDIIDKIQFMNKKEKG